MIKIFTTHNLVVKHFAQATYQCFCISLYENYYIVSSVYTLFKDTVSATDIKVIVIPKQLVRKLSLFINLEGTS